MSNIMIRANKVRIYPNKIQQNILNQSFGACRYIYNRSLALKIFAYKKYGISLSKYDLQKRIVKLKKRYLWLSNTYSQSLQNTIWNLDIAYKNFFRRVKKGETCGFPKFKSKHNSKQSMQYPQGVQIKDNKIYIPKAGWIKAKGHRNFEGKIKTVTVSLEAGKYYAAILIDDGIDTITESHNGKTIALDLGVENIITDSEGNFVKPIDFTKEQKKLKKRQRELSRKVKGSNNRRKAKLKLARQYQRISNIRKDYLHKISAKYSENQTVIIEDLRISNMTKSAKGTLEEPGVNIKAKSGLNRVILQQGWGMLIDMLEYKTALRGGKVIRIDPKYTSQKCSNCGYTSQDNRETQSKFICKSCNYTDNADINAAKNIKTAGMAGLAWSNLEIA